MNRDRITRDYSISVARLVATICIILCHMQQYYGSELCWWFNVGVQMFLFISGYLYANKKIVDSELFFIKNLIKILIPYYCCVIITWLFSYISYK